jgi:hypothetical protein
MIKKVFILFLLQFFLLNISAQRFGIDYRTVLDTTFHFLTFNKNGTVTLKYIIGRGRYWNSSVPIQRTYSFKNVDDTLYIKAINDSLLIKDDQVEKRIINSNFIVKPHAQLYDLNSGYCYIDKRKTKKIENGAIVFDGKVYPLKKRNSYLPDRLKNINNDDYNIIMLKGQDAYLKYGLDGMNGVFEFEKK